jgi:hypothetical protein
MSCLQVITQNVVTLKFDAAIKFDRVCSTEMFEHMKKCELMFDRVIRRMVSCMITF